MPSLRIFAFSVLLALSIPVVHADSLCPETLKRPCVGLVLGGGGARGTAHIGVIRALEQQGMPVDVVVGTSIGSFVGALYASGRTADEIETLFLQTDWNAGYIDNVSRGDAPNRRKRQMDAFPIQLGLGFDGHSVKLPQGFLQGQGMKSLIDTLLGSHVVFESFDDLPIPFRAVAANIETGEEVVLADGDLNTALQISMSLPGILRPIEYNGQLLVDGGIVNNLPISVAKSMGADIVIAVDIGSPSQTREELTSSLDILRQLTSFLTVGNVEAQKRLLTDKDIYLRPELGDITLFSFDKTREGAQAGYREAIAQFTKHPSVQAVASADSKPSESEQFLRADQGIPIAQIQLQNNSRLGDDYILDRLGLSEGAYYSPENIQAAIKRLYGQGTLTRVTTNFDKHDSGGYILNAQVDEKEWGPGYLDFKMSFEDDLDRLNEYQVGVSYRRTNLSPYGAEWYSTAEFGTEKSITSAYYAPINTSGFYFNTEAGDARRSTLHARRAVVR